MRFCCIIIADMKKVFKLWMLLLLVVCTLNIKINAQGSSLKILFTSNLLDSIEPVKYEENDTIKAFGGYTNIKDVLSNNSDENTLIFDAGNFSTGSIYSAINTTSAPSLTLMSNMGYDAILLAEEEIANGEEDLGKMLSVLESNPTLLKGNLNYEDNGSRNVRFYQIFQKAGKKIAVFGVVDTAHLKKDTKPYFSSEKETARNILNDIGTENVDIIICLYNGDNSDASSFASEFNNIDLIICSNMSNEKETKVGNTAIVGCASRGREVGSVVINDGSIIFKTIEVTKSDSEDEEFKEQINNFQKEVQSTILKRYGLSYQNSFARTTFTLDGLDMEKENFALADLIADAYRSSYIFREDDKVRTVVSITNGQSINNALYRGEISVNDIFSLVSSQTGDDNLAGLSLIRVYLSGSDLRKICELDASSLKDDKNRRLFFGGLKYDYNENRPLWNRVEEVYVSATTDYYIPIDNKTMYPVVMSTKVYKSLNDEINNSEDGLSWSPIGIRGEEFPELRTLLLRNNDGTLIKEWSSIASYIRKGEKDTTGKYIIDSKYSGPVQRKKNDNTLNPLKLFKNIKEETLIDLAKKVGYVIAGVIVLKLFVTIINKFFVKETTDN